MNVKLVFVTFISGILELSYSKKSLRVIGGRNTFKNEFPFVGYLTQEIIPSGPPISCTGSILTINWTLTAAHCFDDADNVLLIIPSYENINEKVPIGIGLAIFKHPSYKNVEEGNDISLIKTTPVNIPQYAKISAVDYTTLFGLETLIMGYGETNITHNSMGLPIYSDNQTLQVLQVIVKKCQALFGTVKHEICLASRCNIFGSTCSGDSGGPLLHSSGVVGVASSAITSDCFPEEDVFNKRMREAGFYTAVSPYIDWITNTITNN